MVKKRLSIRMTAEAYDEIVRLAANEEKSIAELIRDALALEKFVNEIQQAGGKILIQNKGDNQPKQMLMIR